MKTYTEYFEGKISHEDFYAQFVTQSAKDAVVRVIGIKKLTASTDGHMNDIPLSKWDIVAKSCNTSQLREAFDGKGVSLASKVCVAKAAGRAVLGDHKI